MSRFFLQIIANVPLWTAILSFFIAQFIKLCIEYSQSKKIKLSFFISSGGMPSSHSAFVTALSVSVGMREGFHSSFFALCAVVSLVVMYDAAGVRRAAGTQAAVLNKLIETLENPDIKLEKKLKELLGHTPVEVAAGALLGIIIAVIVGHV